MSQVVIAVLLIGGIFISIGCQTYLICCCNGTNRSATRRSENESLLEV